MAQAVYTKLPNRALIRVSGADRFDFLQGLITQDILLLKSQDLIYSCLLTPNGKFLFDFLVFEDGDSLVIDCEGGDRATALLKRLSMFKLRSDVALELMDDVDVFQIFYPTSSSCGLTTGPHPFMQDSRLDRYRTYSKPENIIEVDFTTWDTYRIRAEIPDGSRDLIPEKSFLHESEIVGNTAVSYDKGCYMGQELVSRMHHRGLVKKQLRCIDIKNAPKGADLRSQCGDVGLALVKA